MVESIVRAKLVTFSLFLETLGLRECSQDIQTYGLELAKHLGMSKDFGRTSRCY